MKILIVFTGSTSRLAPLDDPTWTVWSVPPAWSLVSRVALWFDIHRPEVWRQPKPWNPDYAQWLLTMKTPIVMWPPVRTDLVPAAIPFPSPPQPGAPYAGTFDWMMQMAIEAMPTEIGVYGVDYNTAHEMVYQRFGAAYWIGYARGRGITVTIPDGSPLLGNMLPGRYGPDFPPWPRFHHPYHRIWNDEALAILCEEQALRERNPYACE